jgi:hypothetical protein
VGFRVMGSTDVNWHLINPHITAAHYDPMFCFPKAKDMPDNSLQIAN